MRSTDTTGRKTRPWGRIATATALMSLSALALSACGTKEWNGNFTVANGDSSFYVGNGPHRPETVTVKCSESGGVITATIAESETGNVFTTTQPESGSGYAGGALTMGDGTEFEWKPLDGITDEDIRGNDPVFEDDMQDGSPVTWTDNDTMVFNSGLRQKTTKTDDGQVQVRIPGEVDCAEGAGE